MAPVTVKQPKTANTERQSRATSTSDEGHSRSTLASKERKELAEEDPFKLYQMNPFPREMFLRRCSIPELMRLAHIANRYFIWVRGYMAETRVLNIKPCSNKMCLSREPCRYTNFSCTHRVIRNVSSLKTLYDAGLLCVDTICIQVPSKPRNTRSAIHMVKKVTGFFKGGIRRIYIDVNNETPYVEIIKNLLTANDDTLDKLFIRNSDVDNSRFNFPHFLNRTSWFVENFPMRKGFLERKKQRHAEKRRNRANAQQNS